MENYKIIFENNQFFVEMLVLKHSLSTERTYSDIGRFNLTNKEGYIAGMVYGKGYKQFGSWKKAIEKKIGKSIDWNSYEWVTPVTLANW